MAERKTTIEDIGKRPVYTQAVVITGCVHPVTASDDSSHLRTVVTSLTKGVVSLRYAPRTPKAPEPIDTAC